MPRIALEPAQIMTKAEYLEFEESASEKHEFVSGQVFAMTDFLESHVLIAVNLQAHLWNSNQAGNCQVFGSTMKLEIGEAIYYSDVMIVCDKTDDDQIFVRNPCLIAEVSSERTEDIDRTEKLFAYRKLESLQAYILLSQDTMKAEIYRRDLNGWRYEVYESGDTIKLPCVNAEFKLDALYKNVELESA